VLGSRPPWDVPKQNLLRAKSGRLRIIGVSRASQVAWTEDANGPRLNLLRWLAWDMAKLTVRLNGTRYEIDRQPSELDLVRRFTTERGAHRKKPQDRRPHLLRTKRRAVSLEQMQLDMLRGNYDNIKIEK